MAPPARGRRKKRRSRKWSASKGEAPAPPSREEHGGEAGSSAADVPAASDVQVTISFQSLCVFTTPVFAYCCVSYRIEFCLVFEKEVA